MSDSGLLTSGGRIALVTGASAGIGLETARRLATAGNGRRYVFSGLTDAAFDVIPQTDHRGQWPF
jgi:NAD(P)-dependent dehydrogenase (short-subunit alcohol dehydrogenase family)